MRVNMPLVTACIVIIVIFVLVKNNWTSSSKGKVKIAVLGDSYVWEMNHLFVNESGKRDLKVRYYGTGGIRITQIQEDSIYEETVLYKPDIVVVLAGSNDLDSNTDLTVIKKSVNELITKLCTDIVRLKGVYFVEPVLRTKVRHVDSAQTYESRRELLEAYLRELELMILFDGMKEDEMREDGVHGNKKGMDRLKETIMRYVFEVRDVNQCDAWKQKLGKA